MVCVHKQNQQTSQGQIIPPSEHDLPLFADQPPIPKKALPVLRVLGQAQNTYIIAEGPDGVYLIDQHAAHERIVFEDYSKDIYDKSRQWIDERNIFQDGIGERSFEQAVIL